MRRDDATVHLFAYVCIYTGCPERGRHNLQSTSKHSFKLQHALTIIPEFRRRVLGGEKGDGKTKENRRREENRRGTRTTNRFTMRQENLTTKCNGISAYLVVL